MAAGLEAAALPDVLASWLSSFRRDFLDSSRGLFAYGRPSYSGSWCPVAGRFCRLNWKASFRPAVAWNGVFLGASS